jgi:sialate O-acetylesterase
MFNTAFNALRTYYIPEEFLNFSGPNSIAVKVYDSYQQGGIVSGDVGIYTNRFDLPLQINLQGKWKFRTGDDLQRKEANLDDSQWDEIFAPAKWEDQGYRDYDGFAWYRKTFLYTGNLSGDKVVLVLGKIDDVDQVYVNGILVGSTGEFSDKPGKWIETGERWKAFRGYYVPASVLKKNQKNTIAIRVYDSGGEGGIYEGPIGFISQPDYINYWRQRKELVND